MEPAWITLSALQHYAYCPEQARLLRDGVWADNRLTVEGDTAHERVDQRGSDRRRGVRAHHRVELVSHELGVYGIADTIEETASGDLTPVEHKRCRGAGDLGPTIVQVVAQALCLREMTGLAVSVGYIFIVKERRREHVVVDDHAGRVRKLIGEAHTQLAHERVTAPAYQPRICNRCSVAGACQPGGLALR